MTRIRGASKSLDRRPALLLPGTGFRRSREPVSGEARPDQHCTWFVLRSQYVLFEKRVLAPFHPRWSLLNLRVVPFETQVSGTLTRQGSQRSIASLREHGSVARRAGS